jgi:ATP-dependent RNA helicase RhlE
MSNSNSSATNGFDQFGLHDSIMRGIHQAGFKNPRPIQAATIPAGLEGRDVLGLAQTGTGKTAAFGLPIIQRLITGPRIGPRALILAPTRELATQIATEISGLSRFTRVTGTTIYGGVSQRTQMKALRQLPDIVVGCPGRVLDLLQQGELHLDQVETLVLDEADHMFDMGFLRDIRKIIASLPPQRQNLLFSATMPKEIRGLADELLNSPQVAELASTSPANTIDHALIMVAERRKRDLLEWVLNGEDCNSAIVFTRTKHRARRLADQLNKVGYKAVGLQGNMSQAQRDRAMLGFRDRRFNILVATDIVARGIDVSGVSHVINFDVPNTPEAYTHRIGRTGRAELEGIACTFVTGEDHSWLRATEKMIGSTIARRQVSGFEAEPEIKVVKGRTGQGQKRSPARGGPGRSYGRSEQSGGQPQGRHRNEAGAGRRRRRAS